MAADAYTVRVRVMQASACSSCKAKSMCVSADNREKFIDCQTEGSRYEIGDQVEVQVEERLGWKAVFLAYILPFFIIIAVLFTLHCYVDSEAVLGIASLVAAAAYFALLALAGKRLRQTFSFHVRKI